MQRLGSIWILVGAMLGVLSGTSQAVPVITYTESARVTGTIGTQSFSNALLTITGTDGAPGAVVDDGNGFFTNTATTTFTLEGVGSGSLLGAVFWFVNQFYVYNANGDSTGAGGVAVQGLGTLLATLSDSFTSDGYDLATSYGPLAGSAFIRDDIDFSTDLGGLRLTAAGDATFRAMVRDDQRGPSVPEPGSLALLLVSLAGLATLRRRIRA